ncbi:protein-tyrosine phosphatase family protein [Ornithinimicrobium panacihumi]|uniref:protein-tyrosine phosphatase family protein n=1 Tax=Ornithinimicrobium panacihumi TaxID=2008449 RepID=UPI003F8C7AAC
MTWTRGVVGVLELPDGRLVRGRERRDGTGGELAEWTLTLAGRPVDPSFPGRELRWRDFGVPSDTEDAVQALTEAWERAATQRVEVVCAGGNGRTGTALAALTILAASSSGRPLSGDDAIRWVRAAYRRRAVETPGQRRWLRELAGEGLR